MELPLWIRSFFDSKGTDEAEKGLGGVKREAKDTDGTLKELGYTAENLKKSLVELVAFAEVVEFFKEGVAEAVKLETSYRTIASVASGLGQNQEELRKRIESVAEEMSRAAGVESGELVRAIAMHYVQTKDLEQAITRTAYATALHTRRGIEEAEANDLVADAMRGRTRSLEKLLGENWKSLDVTEKVSHAVAALKEIMKETGGEEDDNALKLARLTAGWKNLREEAGTAVLPVLVRIGDAFHNIGQWVQLAGKWVGDFFTFVVSEGKAVGEFWKKVVMGGGLGGDLTGALEGFRVAQANALRGLTDDLQKSLDAQSEKHQKYLDDRKRRLDDFIKQELTGNKQLDKDQKEKDQHQADLEMKLLQSRLEAAHTYAEKYKAEMALLAHEEAAALGELVNEQQNTEANRLKVTEIYANKRLAVENKFADELKKLDTEAVKSFNKWSASTLEEAKKNVQKMVELWLYEAREKKRLDEEDLRHKQELARAFSGLIGELFGDSKAAAIAQAIINTYEGATKALSQGGIYGAALAAIVIATGLAQVAKIESTQPSTSGKGFDDPRNDQAAYLGGRRWAHDMIGEFTSGVSSGWAGAMMGGSVSHNNARTFNLYVDGGAVRGAGNQSDLKQLNRSLEVVGKRIEGARVIARRRGGS